MRIDEQIEQLIQQLGTSQISSAAYDTAWFAHLIEFDEPIGHGALEWLRENQMPNGCWGAKGVPYNHDRVICTLAAMIALTRWGNEKDRLLVRRARLGLDAAVKSLQSDVAGATVGFEMIVPLLLDTAYDLGAIKRKTDKRLTVAYDIKPSYDRHDVNIDGNRRSDVAVDQLREGKKQKLAALPDGVINRHVTVAFSAEMVGQDGIDLLDVDNILEFDGSVGGSPSATAFYALHVRPGDVNALAYLRNVAELNNLFGGGGIPEVAPFDIYEIGWALWNLALIADCSDFNSILKPKIDFLIEDWRPGKGISFAKGYALVDGDNSSVIFDVLRQFGRSVDLAALLSYERDDHFCCYDPESTPSIGVNAHVLSALRTAGLEVQHPTVQKVIRFLASKKILNTFWADKWHASPYYVTSHIIIAAAGYANDLALEAVDWIIKTQRDNGAWGYYKATAEETAYCLQALLTWQRYGVQLPSNIIQMGLEWLAEHQDPPYEPLWICKCLYNPELIVKSAILSALKLGSNV